MALDTLAKKMQAARFARQLKEPQRAGLLAQEALAIGGSSSEMEEAQEILDWANNPRVAAPPASPQRVTVVNFEMEFWSMVSFMVKAAIAAIPALIILIGIALFIVFVVGATFGLMEPRSIM